MIGVFDSGFGGLTVLKSFLERIPNYNYVYLGDNARVPYGGKSEEVVYQYTKDAVDFLFEQGCELIILACNTASALALHKLQQEYLPKKYPNRKILGVVRPIAESIASDDSLGRVAIIGTRATVNSGVYSKEILKLNKNKKIFAQSAALLVPLIEEDYQKEEVLDIVLRDYLQFVEDNKTDRLVLACTHYPLLIEKIRKIIPKTCKFENPGEIIAKSLEDYLEKHSELKFRGKRDLTFYTTDSIDKFKKLGKRFLGQEIRSIKKINL